MTARLLDGRALATHLREELRQRVERLATTVGHGSPPVLAILGDGHHGAASLYAASLERAARSIGVATETVVDGDALVPAIERLNADPLVAGIVVAQPFADIAAGRRLVEHIDPAKDVDGATPTSAGRLARGEPAFVPATALAVIAILEEHDIGVAGLRAVVVGRSAVVGRPVFSLLLARDATVVVTHTATRDLVAETRRADLIVAAAGVPGLIRGPMIPPGAIVVDCGINATPDGVVGDVAFDEVVPLARAITPVPGGIGPVTPMMVLRQLVEAAERRASAA